jgi:hypothetical protein
VRLQAVRLPDPLHRGARDAGRLGHGADRPVGRFAGRRLTGQGDDTRDHLGRERRDPGRTRLLAQEPGDARGNKPLLPPPHRGLSHTGLPCDRHRAHAIGAQENDPGPPDVLLRAARRRDDRLQASTIPGADLDPSNHTAIIASIAAKGNHPSVTNH